MLPRSWTVLLVLLGICQGLLSEDGLVWRVQHGSGDVSGIWCLEGIGWKAGLSWHEWLSLFSLYVVSRLSVCLHGSDLICRSLGLPRARKQMLPGPLKDLVWNCHSITSATFLWLNWVRRLVLIQFESGLLKGISIGGMVHSVPRLGTSCHIWPT